MLGTVYAKFYRFFTYLWWELNHFTIHQYYERVTRESLQSRLRWYLIDGDYNAFVPPLRQAFWERNVLRRLFEDFAVEDVQTGRRVWAEHSFVAFITTRFSHDESDQVKSLAYTLWRSFCYTATYPFADQSTDPEHQTIDLDGWTQAIALLATGAVRNVGRNRSMLTLYGSGKRGNWLRFASLLLLSQERESAMTVNAMIEDDNWQPPSMLDEITQVAKSQLPLSPVYLLPPDADIRSRISRLVRTSPVATSTTTNLTISYADLLSVVVAMMYVDKGDDCTNFEQCQPVLSLDGDKQMHVAAAKAVLLHYNIQEGKAVSFGDYARFSRGFSHSVSTKSGIFDQEFELLWRALFFSHLASRTTSCPSRDRPPTVVDQIFDFLCPLEPSHLTQNFVRKSIKIYSADSVTGFSREAMLKALTEPYEGKLVILYGSTPAVHTTDKTSPIISRSLPSGRHKSMPNNKDQAEAEGQPVMLALITSSPLWSTFEDGKTTDFYVDNDHRLLEMIPQPRALRYSAKSTKYVDIVNTTKDGRLLFGYGADDDHSAPHGSGLSIDFNVNIAKLSSSPQQPGSGELGYIEVEFGSGDGEPSRKFDDTREWTTVMCIERVSVYGLPSFEHKELEVVRSTHGMSLRKR